MIKEATQEDYLFRVKNHHASNCGKPPQIDDSVKSQYRGYFENEHGEQAIFIYDYSSNKATLTLGDASWEKQYPVLEGKPKGLILCDTELVWLAACWKASTCFLEYRIKE